MGKKKFPLEQYSFLPIDKVLFGINSVDVLPDEMRRLKLKKPLIITGTTLSTQTNIVNNIIKLLPNQNYQVFDAISERAPLEGVLKATKICIEMQADCIIGVGGSTISDAGRVITVLTTYHIDQITKFRNWFQERMPLDLLDSIKKPLLKQIVIPTTLSAGELNFGSGTFDPSHKKKLRFSHPKLAPSLIFYDASLTSDTPSWLWLSTGIKALDHAIERLYSPDCHPITEIACIKSIELLTEFLPKTADRLQSLEDRSHCLMGAWLSMSGFPNGGLGLSHAIGHVLGVKHWIPHGYTSCITQPAVMEFNLPYSLPQQMLFALATGIKKGSKSNEALVREGHSFLRNFIRQLNLPQSLQKLGINLSDLKSIAHSTLKDPGAQNNIYPITNYRQVIKVLNTIF